MSEIDSAIEFLFTLLEDKNVDESLRNALDVVIEQLCLTTINLENCQRDLKAVSDQLAYTQLFKLSSPGSVWSFRRQRTLSPHSIGAYNVWWTL